MGSLSLLLWSGTEYLGLGLLSFLLTIFCVYSLVVMGEARRDIVASADFVREQTRVVSIQ